MVWKKVNNADAGDADHFGGNDLDKISDLFSGVDVDDLDINSDTKYRKTKLKLANSGNTFTTQLDSGEVGSNITVTLPTSTTTLIGTNTTDTITGKTINADDATNVIRGTTPTSGNYLRDNGTKFVSSAIQYYDIPRATYTNTNDIFFRNRNSANDTSPISSYNLWGNGFSPHIGFLTAEDNVEDFGTDTWTDTGGATGVDNGVLKITSKGDNTNIATSSADLGASYVSDSNWVLRFRIRITANTVSGNGGAVYFGLSDLPSTTGQSTNQDFLGLLIKEDVGLVGGNQTFTVHSAEADGSAIQTTGDTNQNFTFNINEWYHWEIARTATTTMEIRCFGKDDQYSKQTGSTFSITIPSSIASLRYFKLCNIVASVTGERNYEIDNLRFWKNKLRSTLLGEKATPALACNSTVNNTSYFMSRTQPWYVEPPQLTIGPYQPYVVENFTRYQTQEEADYFWVPQDTTNGRVSLANDRLEWNVLKDGTNDSVTLKFDDLRPAGAVSATTWELRFKATITTKNATTAAWAQLFFGLFDSPSGTGGNVSQRFNGFVFNANNSTTGWTVGTNNAGGVLNETLTGATDAMSLNTPLYFRLTRVGDAIMSYGVYTDVNYTQLVTQSTYGITTTTQGTQMIYIGGKNNNSVTTADSTFTLRVENVSFVNATSSTYAPPVSGNTTQGGIVPIDPIAWAINFNKTRTTETQIKLRILRHPDPFFTSADDVRTLNLSDYTDQVYRYTPQNKTIPVLETDPNGVYWVQIMGVTNSSQLAVNAIRYQVYDNTVGTPTGVRMLNTHLHYLFKKTEIDNTFDAN